MFENFNFNNGGNEGFSNTFGGSGGFDAFLADLMNNNSEEEKAVSLSTKDLVICTHTTIGKMGYVCVYDASNPKKWHIKEGIIEKIALKEAIELIKAAPKHHNGEPLVIYGPQNFFCIHDLGYLNYMTLKQKKDGTVIDEETLGLYKEFRQAWLEKIDSVVISTYKYQGKEAGDAAKNWKDSLFKRYANGSIPQAYGQDTIIVEAKTVKEPIMTPEEQIDLLNAEATKALLARDMITYQAMKEQIAALGGVEETEPVTEPAAEPATTEVKA